MLSAIQNTTTKNITKYIYIEKLTHNVIIRGEIVKSQVPVPNKSLVSVDVKHHVYLLDHK